MSAAAAPAHGWRPRWHTTLVAVSVLVVAGTLLASTTALLPMAVTTVVALAGGTGFVLGVSAAVSAFFERDTYADSDFWR